MEDNREMNQQGATPETDETQLNNRLTEAFDATTLAQPVGSSYEGNTYVRAETAQTVEHVDAEQVRSDAMPQADAASQSAVMAAPRKPGGKTKRRKNNGWTKWVAVLLIGALLGGAAGGVVGYELSGGGRIQAAPQNTKDITYTEDGNMTISSIAAQAMPAVVSVYNIGTSQNIFGIPQQSDGSAQGYGSGVVISADGLVVTNYHVIENADSLVVTNQDGDQYEAKVLGADSTLDLAVLKIEGSDLPYIEIADSDKVKVGDLAVAIGNPLGSEFANTVTDGIISGIDRKITSENGDLGLLQTNASINSGNSGGALLNGQAQLIGINSMKVASSGVEGMGFAIPSNVVLDFVNSVKDGTNTNTSTKKAWLGLSGYSLDEDLASQVGTDQTSGVLIATVTEGGPAASAGLSMGDIITAIDGTAVSGFEELSAALSKKQPGDTVTLTVMRHNNSEDVQVTLGTQS